MSNLPYNDANLANPFRKLIAFFATAAVIGLALMFSVVVVAIILIAGTIGWCYLWWKTRGLRNQARDFPPRSVVMEGDMAGPEMTRGEVIEGEVIRVVDIRESK